MEIYFTTGQTARKLRVSISTLKRWLDDPDLELSQMRNYKGWRLFSEEDVERLKVFKRAIRKNGKRFNETTLIPVIENENSLVGISRQ